MATARLRDVRIRALVGVSCDPDRAFLRAVLEKSTAVLDWRDLGTNPIVLMQESGNSSVNVDVSVWVSDPGEGEST